MPVIRELNAESDVSKFYYFIYDLDEFNGEGGLDLMPEAVFITKGEHLYNILLEHYPKIRFGNPVFFSLKGKDFEASYFSLIILMMAHYNYIIKLGNHDLSEITPDILKLPGIQKFYDDLTQHPSVLKRISKIYDKRLMAYLEYTKTVQNPKKLEKHFILTNILYGALAPLIINSIQLGTTESLDFARRFLKFAFEIENFYQTTQAFPKIKVGGFTREKCVK